MGKKDNSSKFLTIILAIVISLAAVILLYVNLPRNNKETTNDTGGIDTNDSAILLTLIYNDLEYDYTLEELEEFISTTGTGRYIKSKALEQGNIIINPDLDEPAWEFTGLQISILINEFENLPNNYNLTVTASDGWINTYTKDNVTGYVHIFNETGEVIATTGATMILAYKENGEYYSEIDPDNETGPLRIAFVGKEPITLSNLWAKMVVSIEIIEI